MSFPLENISPPTPDEQREIDALFTNFGGGDKGIGEIYRMVEAQHSVVHNRAQSLTQLAGVVITVTGFSGRVIADTNLPAQLLIVVGLSLVLLAAAICLMRVMPIKWMSSYLYLPHGEWLLTAIRRRQHKNRAFAIATVILILGLVFYVGSISIMLVNPLPAELQRVR